MNQKNIDKDELLADLECGMTKKQLREKYSCANGTLMAHIRRYIPGYKFKICHDNIMTKEFLETTELSVTKISELYNISVCTVWKYITKYNIDYKKNKNITYLEDKDWLYDQYITQNKSLTEISKMIKTGPERIKEYIDLHQITRKDPYKQRMSSKAKETSIEDIIKLYQEGNSCAYVGSIFGCSEEYVRRVLIANNVDRKFGYTSSIHEKNIQDLLGELNINHITNTKKIIPPYEVDIFIPEYNIAIEVNGVYFHSSKFVDKKYHENKRKLCEQKGIRLIQFFEDDLIYKFDIIKKFILTLFDSKDYIHARKCKIITNIPLHERKEFMNSNHIQGYSKCNYHIGLQYNNELVALMLFDGNILTRYATAKRVQGGFSKLVKNCGLNSIKTFVDLAMFTGETYFKTGFIIDKYISPDYKYVISNKRIHKFNFRKNRFQKRNFKFDPTLTESELAELNNINKIYDAGKLRLIWQR